MACGKGKPKSHFQQLSSDAAFGIIAGMRRIVSFVASGLVSGVVTTTADWHAFVRDFRDRKRKGK